MKWIRVFYGFTSLLFPVMFYMKLNKYESIAEMPNAPSWCFFYGFCTAMSIFMYLSSVYNDN